MSAFFVPPSVATTSTIPSRPNSSCYPRCTLAPPLPPSVATIRHPSTNCTIHIVGCVHGSQVSAEDVRTLLDTVRPHTVVLELCPPRLKTLQTIFSQPTTPPKRPRSLSTLSTLFGGIGPALIAYLLQAVYTLQTIVGMTPGIEFRHPIVHPLRWRIVCADIPARDTVHRLHRGLFTPWQSARFAGVTAVDFFRAIFMPPPGGVGLLQLFLREGRRMRELARVVGPLGALGGMVGVVGNAAATALEGGAAGHSGELSGWGVVGETVVGVYVVMSALRFIKVLIGDRDKVMAKKIVECVRGTERGSVICVVVGLLHVNGIVRLVGAELDKERGKYRTL